MSREPNVGDRVSYERRTDKTQVTGIVEKVYTQMYSTSWFPGMESEDVAYRLALSKEDKLRIGHPVTVGASRCRLESRSK